MADARNDKAADRGETGSSAIRHLPSAISTWPRLYSAVLAFLAFEILIFYLFTRAFA
jgi:hypothetical protein